jgi:hypothetical protein
MSFNLSYTAADLNAAINKAKAAAPQSTTYTKDEVDALIQTATPTVDQTFDAASANAQSGVAVQQALENYIDLQKYTIELSTSGIVISSQPFTSPSGGNSYIHTWSFHTVKTLSTSIPNGYYIGVTRYGTIGITINNNQLVAAGVLTDYSGSQLTVGSARGATFADLRIYKTGDL